MELRLASYGAPLQGKKKAPLYTSGAFPQKFKIASGGNGWRNMNALFSFGKHLKGYYPVHFGKQRVIAAFANIFARMNGCSALPNKYASRAYLLPAETLYA
jgi:hypothetical protein